MNILGFNITRTAPWDLTQRASPVPTLSGPAVDFQRDIGWGEVGGVAMPRTQTQLSEEGALAVSAVFKSVRVLSESVAALPLKVYRRDGRRRDTAPDHPLYRVLHDEGNDLMSAMKLREVMMMHLCLWGNFYGEIIRDGRGDVVGIVPINPARVIPRVVKVGDRMRFEFKVSGVDDPLAHDEVFHVAGLGTGLLGKSPIQLHREGLHVSRAAQQYGARFFDNDARPSVVLTSPGQLGDVAYNRLKSDWVRDHQGSSNAGKLAILEEGLSVTTVGMPPEDAQFIETRVFEAREVYGMYRVPPHKVGDLERATFSNIEHQGIEFVQDALLPYLVRIEQAGRLQLLDRSERATFYISHSVDGLLRGDIKARYDAYAVARNWGWLSANDILEMENRNPIEGGDIYLQPLNMVEAGTDPFAPGEPDDDERSRRSLGPGETRALPERYREAKALEKLLRDVIARAVRREVREVKDAVARFLEKDDVDGFQEWLPAFARDQAAWLRRRSTPAFQAMADAMVSAARDELGADLADDAIDAFVTEYVKAFASRQAGSTRGQLLALVDQADDPTEAVEARLNEWESDEDSPERAAKEARRERQRSSNAMTAAVWAVAGVRTLTWRAVGKSCPICDEMDGRTSRIGRPFVGEGDTVADLDVESKVSHPPIHDGCDCIMMPGGGARTSPTSVEVRAVWDQMVGGIEAEAPTTWVQRRNVEIQAIYKRRIADRSEPRDVIIEDLRMGEFEGQGYSLAFATIANICDYGRS